MPHLATKLLLSLSRPVDTHDFEAGQRHWTADTALTTLRNAFDDFDDVIADKRVLDFGCGTGYQAVAMIEAGAAEVVGLDIVPALLRRARRHAAEHGVSDRVSFHLGSDQGKIGTFDVIISVDSMEHFVEPATVLETWRHLLRPGGIALVTFGPPWLAPYGAHMHFFTRVPWVHLLFPERIIMDARSRFRADGAERYEEVEGGLGKLTVRRFERLVAESGLACNHLSFTPVCGMRSATRIPLVRELLINNVAAVLQRPVSRGVAAATVGFPSVLTGSEQTLEPAAN